MTATLAQPATHEELIQKSRFLARAWPIDGVDEAQAHVEQCASVDASHDCYAYRSGQQYRFHDANEPAGSAGRPILQAIDGQGLDRVLVVVTRWFGGIKLGVGGLVRAYGGVAAECLRRAERRELIEMRTLVIALDFACENVLRQIACEFDGQISTENYNSEGFSCQLTLPASHVDECQQRLRDATRGQVRINVPL